MSYVCDNTIPMRNPPTNSEPLTPKRASVLAAIKADHRLSEWDDKTLGFLLYKGLVRTTRHQSSGYTVTAPGDRALAVFKEKSNA